MKDNKRQMEAKKMHMSIYSPKMEEPITLDDQTLEFTFKDFLQLFKTDPFMQRIMTVIENQMQIN